MGCVAGEAGGLESKRSGDTTRGVFEEQWRDHWSPPVAASYYRTKGDAYDAFVWVWDSWLILLHVADMGITYVLTRVLFCYSPLLPALV